MKLEKKLTVTITLDRFDEPAQLLDMLDRARDWRRTNDVLPWPIELELRAMLESV